MVSGLTNVKRRLEVLYPNQTSVNNQQGRIIFIQLLCSYNWQNKINQLAKWSLKNTIAWWWMMNLLRVKSFGYIEQMPLLQWPLNVSMHECH